MTRASKHCEFYIISRVSCTDKMPFSLDRLISTAVRQGWTNSTDGVVSEGKHELVSKLALTLTSPSLAFLREGAINPDQITTDNILQSLKGQCVVAGSWNSAYARGIQVVWIRGLFEAWSRMDRGTDVAKFVQSYLYVQVKWHPRLRRSESHTPRSLCSITHS